MSRAGDGQFPLSGPSVPPPPFKGRFSASLAVRQSGEKPGGFFN